MPNQSIKLSIGNQDTIAGISGQFNKHFPYLKIECFKKPHRFGTGSRKKDMYPSSEKIIAIRKIKPTEISFTPSTTVNQLEKLFEKKLGLHIQVFRKSGNIWLETSATDHWTLRQQNEEGESLFHQLKIERENPGDHDIW